MTTLDATPATATTACPGNDPSTPRTCRGCGAALRETFVDLGMSPLCESYVPAERLSAMEPFYPLHAFVCGECFLVQLDQFVAAEEIFTEYAYFSSYADAWVEHARQYAAAMIDRFSLNADSLAIEVASNDGYLLQHFVTAEIPALGIEPAANVAQAALAKGIPTRIEFFGPEVARQLAAAGQRADLLVANNVLAQVPDLNGFVAGLQVALADRGVLTIEFPHLQQLIEQNQFDTIYHEHFSYFSFTTAVRLLATHGLRVFDVEELPTHGGSLRIYACRAENDSQPAGPAVEMLLAREAKAGYGSLEAYRGFTKQVERTKREILKFLIEAKERGCTVAGYGAPGKGNTLLNYCGIRTDLLAYTVDRNPYKQGKFLPGTRIPIFSPEKIAETRPDYLFVLPWNFKEEIMEQCASISEWGGKFVVPIPTLEIHDASARVER